MSYQQSRVNYSGYSGGNYSNSYKNNRSYQNAYQNTYSNSYQRINSYDNQERNYYSQGNLAYDMNQNYENSIDNFDDRKNRQIHKQKTKTKAKAKAKTKTKVNEKDKNSLKTTKKINEARKNIKANAKLKYSIITSYHWKTLAIAIFIFIGAISFVAAKVKVDSIGVDIRRTREQLKNIKEENAILNAERMEEIDLEYIKREASERLNMSEPQSYQIIYIDVPKQSYTIQHNSGS